jgi:hypothetical protein
MVSLDISRRREEEQQRRTGTDHTFTINKKYSGSPKFVKEWIFVSESPPIKRMLTTELANQNEG